MVFIFESRSESNGKLHDTKFCLVCKIQENNTVLHVEICAIKGRVAEHCTLQQPLDTKHERVQVGFGPCSLIFNELLPVADRCE